MAEPQENLLGDDMLGNGWFPSQLRGARKRAGKGEERVALELMVETDDGRLFSKTKDEINLLKMEMMDSLKHRRLGSASTIRAGSASSGSKVFDHLRNQVIHEHQENFGGIRLGSASKSQKGLLNRNKRIRFDVHSYIEEKKTQQEVDQIEHKRSLRLSKPSKFFISFRLQISSEPRVRSPREQGA